jgi:hypothetical protein
MGIYCKVLGAFIADPFILNKNTIKFSVYLSAELKRVSTNTK